MCGSILFDTIDWYDKKDDYAYVDFDIDPRSSGAILISAMITTIMIR